MNLDIIIAVIGIISAIVGLLTAIIQLKNATHQRRHQESQDNRSYIDIGIGKWLKRALILFGVPFAILLAYREWDSVEKSLWSIKGFADKAITKEITIDSLKTGSWDDVPDGRYQIRVRGNMYFYKCPGDKGAASGYPEGKTLSGGRDGKVVIWSETAPDNPQGNGGEFIVGPQDRVFWKFDTECPNHETVVQKSAASIKFSPMYLN
ncbi:MAG: hypothetical protein V9G98_24230 [Candidatus Competibacter sp.]